MSNTELHERIYLKEFDLLVISDLSLPARIFCVDPIGSTVQSFEDLQLHIVDSWETGTSHHRRACIASKAIVSKACALWYLTR